MTAALDVRTAHETADASSGGSSPAGTEHVVCRLEDLEPFFGEAALVEGVQVALIRVPGDRVFAVSQWDDVARANVMARGIVGTKQGRPTLASPIHKQVYCLETGECLSQEGPRLEVFAVRVDEAGRIAVAV
ncbi:nitrite reductase small subunit NirD [Nesterenkonia sp. F]|uniref:nitrite reductase small subunit NirD n=1 Tax=Nesterenkonia sp. F TaxID=795955 RepID=UPI000255CE6A|nr:nitrite reductase small subunit NirD [Nesterenkonia sp. F]